MSAVWIFFHAIGRGYLTTFFNDLNNLHLTTREILSPVPMAGSGRDQGMFCHFINGQWVGYKENKMYVILQRNASADKIGIA